ncbi:MAG: HDIG domain-containing metalloprotein [Dysosmobacter sp.]
MLQLRPVALSYLKYKRIPHVLGTEQEAIRLATRYGADVEKARVAALLHDCTKKLDMEEQLALCRQYGIAAGRAGAEGPEAAPRQDRRGHRPGRVRCGR